MKKLSIILALCLVLIGCTFTEKIPITPDKLPNAIQGKPYHTQVFIGFQGNGNDFGGVNFSLKPTDSGLKVDLCNPDDNTFNAYKCFIIEGTPNNVTDITFYIYGNLLPSHRLFYKVEYIFEKTYVIKVKESEQIK